MSAPSGSDRDAIAADVASIKKDIDHILPSLVDALKRNRYFEEMEKQLREARIVAEAWRERPLIIGVHDVVLAMRAESPADHAMAEQLCDVMYRSAGIEEFGFVDEEVDPTQISITGSEGEGSRIVVAATQRPGLRVGHLPLRKAIVSVKRQEGPR